ncbi:hypothetical protein Tco_1244731 [Tanacetum coccineum]
MGGSYYPIPCSILSTEKDRKTLQRYPDVPTTSWRIFIQSMDSSSSSTISIRNYFQGSRTHDEKVLIREEAKFPVTKNVNSNSPARNEEEENNKTDKTPDNTKMPIEMEMPLRKAEAVNRAENGAENKSIKTPENDEAVEAPGSQPVAYYLKHKINEKLTKGLVKNNRFNNSLSGTEVWNEMGKAY